MHLLLIFLLFLSTMCTTPSTSFADSFIYLGCSQLKFTPGSTYQNNLNSLLTSLVNSATFSNYNNFTVSATTVQDTIYGVFQCRGDLRSDECSRCVTQAVSQLGTACPGSCGGALQLDECFVRYDNVTFLGVEDETVVSKKCGPSNGLTSDKLTRRDAVLAYLETYDGAYKTYRESNSGDVYGVAQCVGDLGTSECQDCLSDVIERLRTECGASTWGQMYLAKCYVQYSEGGDHAHSGRDGKDHNDDKFEKTLAIIIGLIAGVALIILFVSFLTKLCEEKHKGGK